MGKKCKYILIGRNKKYKFNIDNMILYRDGIGERTLRKKETDVCAPEDVNIFFHIVNDIDDSGLRSVHIHACMTDKFECYIVDEDGNETDIVDIYKYNQASLVVLDKKSLMVELGFDGVTMKMSRGEWFEICCKIPAEEVDRQKEK